MSLRLLCVLLMCLASPFLWTETAVAESAPTAGSAPLKLSPSNRMLLDAGSKALEANLALLKGDAVAAATLNQEAIALYEAQYFTDVRGGGFFDCGYYGDSPDGLVGVTGTVEVKSVIAKVHYATFLRGSHDPAYHWQIVGHIDCSDRDWCDFVSYCADFPEGKQIIVYRIEREDVMRDIEILSERRERFNESVERIRQQIMEI